MNSGPLFFYNSHTGNPTSTINNATFYGDTADTREYSGYERYDVATLKRVAKALNALKKVSGIKVGKMQEYKGKYYVSVQFETLDLFWNVCSLGLPPPSLMGWSRPGGINDHIYVQWQAR